MNEVKQKEQYNIVLNLNTEENTDLLAKYISPDIKFTNAIQNLLYRNDESKPTLVITPSNGHDGRYVLNLIDIINMSKILATTRVKRSEFHRLSRCDDFQGCFLAVGNKSLDNVSDLQRQSIMKCLSNVVNPQSKLYLSK